ncbi:hypothetical protein JCM33374_g1122 [Metschnikowia sp. JCM 33374]|nr:hypothetical protein JCM33374_g1122 [Metschnikowia sp. JCM 33374]
MILSLLAFASALLTALAVSDANYDDPNFEAVTVSITDDFNGPNLAPAFSTNSSSELRYLLGRLHALDKSMKETFEISLLSDNSAIAVELLVDEIRQEIEALFFEATLSLSLSRPEAESLISFCEYLLDNLANYWKKLDPGRFEPVDGREKPDFRCLKDEFLKEKNLVVRTLFDVTRYLGSADQTGKRINKRLLEVQKDCQDTRYFDDPDFRVAATLHKFLKDVSQIFLDYNNLFRLPDGVMLLIKKQFQRKLQEVKSVYEKTQSGDLSSKLVSDATADARLVFRLLPLFRDPIGAVSIEIDTLLADIRRELLRLRMPCGELELCFIKRMRTRFEKVWYSIDWVHQYVNFIYVKSGGRSWTPEVPDFSVANYLFCFADWADLVVSWKIDSLEARLMLFTIRALQNELDSAEVFRGLKHCGLDPNADISAKFDSETLKLN